MDDLIARFRDISMVAGDIVECLKNGDVVSAYQRASFYGLPIEYFHDVMNIEGQEQMNFEHREAVERWTA